jgi:hypothetical protein
MTRIAQGLVRCGNDARRTLDSLIILTRIVKIDGHQLQ